MTCSLSLRFSEEAGDDFGAILRFTYEQYAEPHMHHYAGWLTDAFRRSTEYPGRGLRGTDLRENPSPLRVREHILYDEIIGDELVNARIPHRRQGPTVVF